MKYTHVCLDCGALGVAGGYHDHGGGNAGETIALSALPSVICSFQRIEQEKFEAEEERDDLRAMLQGRERSGDSAHHSETDECEHSEEPWT